MALIPVITGKVVSLVQVEHPLYSHRVGLRDAKVWTYSQPNDHEPHESLTVWVPKRRTGPAEFEMGAAYVFFAFKLSDAEEGYETEGWRKETSTWQESPGWREAPPSAP